MNTENIPQVGSKWEVSGQIVDVVGVKKRGRGYQIILKRDGQESGAIPGYLARLRDFLKAAKPL